MTVSFRKLMVIVLAVLSVLKRIAILMLEGEGLYLPQGAWQCPLTNALQSSNKTW